MEKRYEEMGRRILQALCEADVARRPKDMALVVATAALNMEVTSGSMGATADWTAFAEGDDVVISICEAGSNTRLRFHIPDMTAEQAAVNWVHEL
jgi:hypothetical protein